MAWLEHEIKSGHHVTEYEAGSRLTEYRRQNEHFMGLAYDVISGSGPNGGACGICHL
jgi:Xaa-Pro aminopeptidase